MNSVVGDRYIPICLLDFFWSRIRLDAKLVVKFRFLHHADKSKTRMEIEGVTGRR